MAIVVTVFIVLGIVAVFPTAVEAGELNKMWVPPDQVEADMHPCQKEFDAYMTSTNRMRIKYSKYLASRNNLIFQMAQANTESANMVMAKAYEMPVRTRSAFKEERANHLEAKWEPLKACMKVHPYDDRITLPEESKDLLRWRKGWYGRYLSRSMAKLMNPS